LGAVDGILHYGQGDIRSCLSIWDFSSATSKRLPGRASTTSSGCRVVLGPSGTWTWAYA